MKTNLLEIVKAKIKGKDIRTDSMLKFKTVLEVHASSAATGMFVIEFIEKPDLYVSIFDAIEINEEAT